MVKTLKQNRKQGEGADKKNADSKQEAHGPHRSPEKTVQIKKHIIIS